MTLDEGGAPTDSNTEGYGFVRRQHASKPRMQSTLFELNL